MTTPTSPQYSALADKIEIAADEQFGREGSHATLLYEAATALRTAEALEQRVRELEQDRDSYRATNRMAEQQRDDESRNATQFYRDWLDAKQRAEALEQRVRELERIRELCIKALCAVTGDSRDAIEDAPLTRALKAKERAESAVAKAEAENKLMRDELNMAFDQRDNAWTAVAKAQAELEAIQSGDYIVLGHERYKTLVAEGAKAREQGYAEALADKEQESIRSLRSPEGRS
jgi:hypothetical protein